MLKEREVALYSYWALGRSSGLETLMRGLQHRDGIKTVRKLNKHPGGRTKRRKRKAERHYREERTEENLG